MFRYVIKRLLQAIPTVFGVIVITFILFNVVGGSPAAMTLGKHVSPKALEDFDEQRGANKPLLLGMWTSTRAYENSDFDQHAEAWRDMEGVTYHEEGFITLEPSAEYNVPFTFTLYPQTTYRLQFDYRMRGKGEARIVYGDRVVDLMNPANSWEGADFEFTATGDQSSEVVLQLEGAALDLDVVRLQRKVDHFFDSQLLFYLKQLSRFDFGVSISTNQRISQMLKDGILPSLALTVPIFFIGLIVSVSLSLICAFFRDSWIDRSFVILSVVLMSVNYLVYIIVGQYVFAYKLGWFPIWGFESVHYLVLPVIIGVISGLGGSLRFYRTVMLDEMYKDYVRTAFAKGVSNRGVLFKHVLKNAMIPIVTNVVIAIPFLYTGSLLLESFFGIPGLGYMGINAINSSDIDVVRALVFIGACLYVVANLLTDICYALVDPRVKLG